MVTAFDARGGRDEAVGEFVGGGPGHGAEVVDFTEAARPEQEQPLPEVESSEKTAGTSRARGLLKRRTELGARLTVGNYDIALFLGERNGDIAAVCGLADDFPIPASLGEVTVGEVGVPNALLIVAVEPIVGVTGRLFVVLAEG